MDFEYWEEQQQKRKAQALLTPTEPAHSTGKQRQVTGDGTPHLQQSEISLDNVVPAELKALPQWVLWRYQPTKDGKQTKVPFQPNGRNASTKEDSTWNTFDVCVRAYRTGMFEGIGFVFRADDPYTGIDLDNCLNENGTVKEWAVPIVNELKSVCYWEVSPSGTGLKFWTRAFRPENYINKHPVGDGEIEVYDTGRYFTVTGNRGQGTIDDGQSQIYWLCEKYLKLKPKPKPTTRKPLPPLVNSPSVEECLRLLRNARNADKFERLFRGDPSEHKSDSEADAALCAIIAFFSQDHAVIDTIFRSSGLMREKWDVKHSADGRNYGEMTIDFVLDNLTETYTPPKVRLSPQIPKRTSHLRKRTSGRLPLMMKRSTR